MSDTARLQRAPLLIAAGVVAASVAVLGEVTESVRESDALVRVDQRIVDAIVARRADWLTTIARAVTTLGNPTFVAVVVGGVAVALLLSQRPRHALLLLASSAGTAILVTVVKHAVDRPRPPPVHRLVASNGYAFPSSQGHSPAISADAPRSWQSRSLPHSPSAFPAWTSACTGRATS